MHDFDDDDSPLQSLSGVSALRLCLMLWLSALIGLWLSHDSLGRYVQEHYQRNTWLLNLDESAPWHAGAAVRRAGVDLWDENGLLSFYGDVVDGYDRLRIALNPPPPEPEGQELAGPESVLPNVKPLPRRADRLLCPWLVQYSPHTRWLELDCGSPVALTVTPVPASRKPAQAYASAAAAARAWARDHRALLMAGRLTLASDAEVFFGGDSLMEGVAPHVSHWLKKQGIKSKDRSRFSTGLSYPNPKVRDWPQEVESALENNPQIKLVIMFLGPNDPWDFPDPAAPRRKFLRFRTQAWEDVYSERIGRILSAAEQHGAHVIWLGLPYMKKESFNQQMAYLDGVMRRATVGRALYLPTKDLLSGTGAYTDSLQVGGKTVTVRAADGVHFSPVGQRILAQAIQAKIRIDSEENAAPL